MVEKKSVCLFENVHHEAVKGEKEPVNQAVENAIRRDVAISSVNEVVRMNLGNLADLPDFAQHVTSNLINNIPFTVSITHLVRKQAQVAVADEDNFNDKSVTGANQGEGATLPSPLTEIYSDSLHSSSEEKKNEPKKK